MLAYVASRQSSFSCLGGGGTMNSIEEPQSMGFDDNTLLSRIEEYHAPSVSEAEDLRKAIEADEDSIASIDEDIAMLKVRQRDLKASIEMKASLLAPIRRLPNEILGEVFDHACTSGWIYPKDHPNRTTYTALILGQVNRYWRQLALDTPGLWSQLHVALVLESTRRDAMDVSYVFLLYLSRSKDHSLDVSLSSEGHWDMDTISQSERKILEALMGHTSRWRRFIASAPDFEILSPEPPDFSRLQQFDLDRPKGSSPSSRPDWFSRAPNLKSLFLNAGSLAGATLEVYSFKWEIVENLELAFFGDVSSQDLMNILYKLSSAPNLVKFNCLGPRLNRQDTLAISEPQTFHFRKLEEMKLGDSSLLSLGSFMDTPQLQCLEIACFGYSARLHARKLVHQNGANLVFLTVLGSIFSGDDCLSCLASMINLSELNCDYMSSQEVHVLAGLLEISPTSQTKQTPLPLLALLSIRFSSRMQQEILTSMVNMLESRRYCKEPKLKLLQLECKVDSRAHRISPPVYRFIKFKCTRVVKVKLQNMYNGGLSMCINGNYSPISHLIIME